MNRNIEKLLESDQIKALIALTGADFYKALDTIKRRHYERLGFKFLDPDNPAAEDTQEG